MSDIFDSIKGKRVLVTGSSRGIGKAIAKRFLEYGAKVAIHGSKETEALINTYNEFLKISSDVIYVCGDLAKKDEVDKIYNDTEKVFGGVDVLICNASYQIRTEWDEVTYSEAEEQMQINFYSALRLIQLCVPEMKKNKWGRIITIGSVLQVRPYPELLIYSASKSAMQTMVRALAPKLAEYNITVNNVAPGTIYTDRNTKVLADFDYHEKVRNGIPLKIIGDPDDCTGIPLVLGSDAGRFITGENIFIDGGRHI